MESILVVRLSRALLRLAETFYLYTNGWRREEGQNDIWHPPAKYPNKDAPSRLRGYRGGHAINSQKFWDNHKV